MNENERIELEDVSDAELDVLDAMAEVLEVVGCGALVADEFVVHDPRFFPDRWTEDARGIYTAIRRVLALAGLEEVVVELVDEREGPEFREADDNVMLVAVEDGRAAFALLGMSTPKLLLPQICLEVARTALALKRPQTSPYRDDHDDAPPLPNDVQASLAQITLGFGGIGLQSSSQLLKGENLRGGLIEGRWRRSEVGGLAPAVYAMLLGAQLVLREEDPTSLRATVGDHLGLLNDAYARLQGQADALSEHLGLRGRSEWPAPRPRFQGPLPADPQGQEALALLESQFLETVARPNEGGIGFAVRSRATWPGLIVGGCIALTCAAFEASGWVTLGAILLCTVAGALLRPRSCSECSRKLASKDTQCASCGAAIVSEIRRRKDRLAAAEAYDARRLNPEEAS